MRYLIWASRPFSRRARELRWPTFTEVAYDYNTFLELPPTSFHDFPRPFQWISHLEEDDMDLAQLVAKKVKGHVLTLSSQT